MLWRWLNKQKHSKSRGGLIRAASTGHEQSLQLLVGGNLTLTSASSFAGSLIQVIYYRSRTIM